ncbi:MAG: hypothetical protein EOP21_05965 [Hyphomicrobiales bacterium]|nr:MAG: hypothetical protein EOP21_05965 [Hyphomicrobiales bacterium]
MNHIDAGDVVIAVPITDCSIGHPPWQENFDNPEMDRKTYMVTWSGFSAYWKRPILSVAGRRGHFCAGCFAKQKPLEPVCMERREAVLEPLSA